MDSTFKQLNTKDEYLQKLAEKDICTAQNLIDVSQTIVELIAVFLAIFSVIGGFLINNLFKQSRLIRREHHILKKEWENARKEIEALKDASIAEGRELLQILFYITEGDTRLYEKTEEAVKFYKEAQKIRDDYPQVYAKLGRAYYILEEYTEAILYLEKGYKLAPKNTSILNTLARLYTALQQFDKAEQYFKKVLTIDPDNNIATWGLGHNYLEKKDFHNAEIMYKKSQLTDSDFFVNFNLALIYACQKEFTKSISYAERSLVLLDKKLTSQSDLEWVLGRKVIILVILNNYEEARKIINHLKSEYCKSSVLKFILKMFKLLFEINQAEQLHHLLKLLK